MSFCLFVAVQLFNNFFFLISLHDWKHLKFISMSIFTSFVTKDAENSLCHFATNLQPTDWAWSYWKPGIYLRWILQDCLVSSFIYFTITKICTNRIILAEYVGKMSRNIQISPAIRNEGVPIKLCVARNDVKQINIYHLLILVKIFQHSQIKKKLTYW